MRVDAGGDADVGVSDVPADRCQVAVLKRVRGEPVPQVVAANAGKAGLLCGTRQRSPHVAVLAWLALAGREGVVVVLRPAGTDAGLASDMYRRAVNEYMEAEVLPYVTDAWVDYERTKVGYEIPLTRHFYKYVPPRPLEEIDAEIRALEDEIQALLTVVTK